MQKQNLNTLESLNMNNCTRYITDTWGIQEDCLGNALVRQVPKERQGIFKTDERVKNMPLQRNSRSKS